jgi:hypothetical protein
MNGEAVIGLSGTGKTSYLRAILETSVESDSLGGKSVVLVTPLSLRRKALKQQVPQASHSIHTIASLSLDMSKPHRSGSPFLDVDSDWYERTQKDQQELNEYFGNLSVSAKKTVERDGIRRVSGPGAVLIDDFEAIWPKDLKFLAAYIRSTGANVVVAGDPLRFIDRYDRKDIIGEFTSRLIQFFGAVGIAENSITWTYMTEDHRCRKRIHSFANALAVIASQHSTRRLEWNLSEQNRKERDRVPLMKLFTNESDQYNYLVPRQRNFP